MQNGKKISWRFCASQCPNPGVLHHFPEREEVHRRLKWMQLLGVKKDDRKHLFACGDHFSPNMTRGKFLVRNAYPDRNIQLRLNTQKEENIPIEDVETTDSNDQGAEVSSIESASQISALQEEVKRLESVIKEKDKIIINLQRVVQAINSKERRKSTVKCVALLKNTQNPTKKERLTIIRLKRLKKED